MSRRSRNKREEERKDKKVKKKSGILKKILILLLIILIGLAVFIGYRTKQNGGGMQGLLSTLVGHNEETLKNLDPIQVLLMGVSTDNGGKLTDTIIVGSYDPKTQKASLLSIPRDTFVGKSESTASAYDKINALYQKSPEKTLEAVNSITGLELEYYVVVDTQALIKLVDVIGGVEFYVPQDMVYDDPSQDLHINLKEGLQTLDGDKAEQLLRYRHGNKDKNGNYIGGYSAEYGKDDIGRMKTQRNFIMETVKQTIQAKNILKIKDIIDIAYEYIETNIPISVIKDYVPYAINVDIEGMQSEVLPGESSQIGPQNLWFFKPNKKQVQEVVNKLYFTEESDDENVDGKTNNNTTNDTSNTTTGNTADTSNNTSTSNGSTEEVTKTEASKIKIEILNGSGSEKALSEVKKELASKGYKITKTTKTTSTAKTTIINKTDVASKYEEDIKETLGVGNISTSSVSSSNVDITIIIGKDYK